MMKTLMKSMAAASLLLALNAWAAVTATELKAGFDQRYADYLRAESQMLFPFPALDKEAFKQLRQARGLAEIYRDPDRYYNNKVYTLTLYRDDARDEYYLDAKGGFWGMDELAYGPIKEKDLH